jgi:hypothetical protein
VSGQLESFGIDGLDGCKLACWCSVKPCYASEGLWGLTEHRCQLMFRQAINSSDVVRKIK